MNMLKRAIIIESTLEKFGIKGKLTEINLNETFAQFVVTLDEKFDNKKSPALSKTLAKKLKAAGGYVNIQTDLPRKDQIGIEIASYNIYES